MIPENQPERKELKKVTKALLDFLPLHSIYLSFNNNSVSPKTIITLILSKKCEIDAMELKPLVSRLFKNYPQFSYTLFEHWWATDLWDEGSLFLMNHANGNTLAYTSKEANKTFRLNKTKTAKRRLRRTEKEYQLLANYAECCFTYSKWYLDSGNYLQATLHLHQALKYTFQKVELVLMGEYYASQSLQEHQTYLSEFYPDFGCFFDGENEEESNAIKQLDASFRVVRYKKKYKENFKEEMIAFATAKAGQIAVRVYEIFEACVAECKLKIKNIEIKNHALL
ncbi:HEPN domain-containing protein [Flavobacterium beibuense]|uniref:HEPN domain-containing protein n=2 Tax=Flavobacterium beibuense TaxID=657326 RepID=A0A444W8W7_9FLAO|nr:HEPN domain-containing protein [Flavobacterium beibuense]